MISTSSGAFRSTSDREHCGEAVGARRASADAWHRLGLARAPRSAAVGPGADHFIPHAISAERTMRASRSCCRAGPTRPTWPHILIADGEWREAALGLRPRFLSVRHATLAGARLAWKLLSGREGVERRYWAQDDAGRWCRTPDPCGGGAARLGAAANSNHLCPGDARR